MSSSRGTSQISVGDEVYGSDGDKVGTVAEVQSSYIVIEKGFFFPTDYYIPTSASDPLACPASYGYYLHDAAAIWVRPYRGRTDMAATLAHELAHAVPHDACTGMMRDVREVVAESVAYAV